MQVRKTAPVAIATFCFICFGGATGRADEPRQRSVRNVPHPVVFSYNYPWGSDTNPNSRWTDPWFMDFSRVRLSTANMVDHVEVARFRQHWRTAGRRILARANCGTKDSSVRQLVAQWDEALKQDGIDGMAVDEFIGAQVTPERMKVWIEAVTEIRRRHPDKVLAFWSDNGLGMVNKFGDAHKPLLIALRDHADFIMPEIYYRESTAADFATQDRPFALFRKKVEEWERAAPGITPKILMGLGAVQNADWGYDNRDDIDYGEFLAKQIEICATDPVLKHMAGIALYAPGYLRPDTLSRVNRAIIEHYGLSKDGRRARPRQLGKRQLGK